MIRKMNVAERKLKTWKNMAKVSLQSTDIFENTAR